MKLALHRILVWMISRNLTRKQAYKEVYLKDPSNEPKGLTKETFARGFRKLGLNFDEKTLKALFCLLDENRDGFIDIGEWVHTIPDRIVHGGH